jgi:5-(carboxyamino)imidazole ribonucleotide synthase
MFLTKGDELLVNEIAPRPHNSGHFTNEACSISQFEQHIRAILDLPLMKPELLMPAAMVNILGPKEFCGSYEINGLRRAFSVQNARLYIYGKRLSQPQRKLGHITAIGQSRNLAIARASKCKKSLRVVSAKEEGVD